MQVKQNRRFVYRQLILPEEYQQKLQRVKQIIAEFTYHKPSSEVTLMCLIDEFINLHDGESRREETSEPHSEDLATGTDTQAAEDEEGN